MTAQRVSAAPSPRSPEELARGVTLLDAALDLCNVVPPRPRRFESLPGGLTNVIYKVSGPTGEPVVARLSSSKSGLLAIDRLAECHNARSAAESGVAPRVIACEPIAGISIVEWIDGRTFAPTDLDDSRQIARVAAACVRLHAGARCTNDFDMFTVQRNYLAIVQTRGYRLPAGYLDYAEAVKRISEALSIQASDTVPCHNDLLAANIIDDGERIWFIDYEYAGNNDPCFELGNIWSEANLPIYRLEELVTGYFGYRSPAKIARARLLALMSKYGWMLWAAIQDAISGVDFDFWNWGLEKYERAVAEFGGPDFMQLLDAAQQPDQSQRSAP